LKLAGRIKLGPGESLSSSAAIPGAGIAVAAIDSPDGRKLRIGLNINPEDIGRWSGADKGHTVILDQAGVDKLDAAIGRMQDGAKSGTALLKVFEKREGDLHKREQVLLNRQYPDLTKQQGRELGSIGRDLTLEQQTLAARNRRQEARLAGISDPDAQKRARALHAEIAAAQDSGDVSAQAAAEGKMRLLLTEHGEHPGITYVMYARTTQEITDSKAEIARLQDRRAQLTANPVALSADDQAELDQIREDLVRNDDLWGDFNDGSVLASGAVSGQWGDIRWETSMVSGEPTFRMAVAPYGGDRDPFDATEPIEAADLRKLAALLTENKKPRGP
jgi:hypothetical protein